MASDLIKHTSDATFQADVLQSSTPVLLDFWAGWCIPCRMMSPTIDKVADERADYKVGKVNVDEQPELARKFNVMGIPTLVVMRGGKVVSQSSGARPKDKVLDLLR